MLKHIIAGCCFALLGSTASAQTLFTYADDSVSVKEFLQAYQKNNTKGKDAKALRDYLDLYIASRLKIKEAVARGYDTLPQMVADLQGLREQILPSYLKDEESVSKLVAEAFTRSQKDIHLAHIFISLQKNGLPNAAEAQKRAAEAYSLLQKGAPFTEVARRFSDDPAVAVNGGDAGFVTAFSLPYELENLAYKTPVGKISSIHQSKSGYHIFKNVGERKAWGRMKAAQILLAFPPDADAATKQSIQKRADSIYNRLLKGDDFGKLATQFSNDAISVAAEGQLPEFGIGQYDAAFENVVFALPKDGAISKPFATTHGYHIVKRLARVPAPANLKDAKVAEALRQRVEGSDRMQTAMDALAQKVLQQAPFKKQLLNDADLWAYTDSVLDYKVSGRRNLLAQSSPVYTLGSHTETVADWISYAQGFRYKADGSGIKPYPQLWNEFVQTEALAYYKSHLEDFNEAFRQQMKEFKEGNLFFEIMQHQVWNNAGADTVALQNYYNKHKSKYVWRNSADAVIFYAPDAATATAFRNELVKAPQNWKEAVTRFADKISADSGRFELAQLPNGSGQVKAGSLTPPLVNSTDHSVSFALVVRHYNKPEQRSFAEAKGLVVTDYQAAVEQQWITELKKKYPIVINQNALKALKL